MRPAQIKEQREKEIRQVRKEIAKVRNEIYDLPLIKLDKPIRHGWYKEIVLTKNIDRYKNKKDIEEIFDILNTYFWGRTKKECDKHWDNQRSKHFIFREVPTISKKQFNKLSLKAASLCTPFQYRECRKLKVRFYIRIPKNAYRVKYTRAYNTHVKMHDPELHSRKAFLEQRLSAPGIFEANSKSYKGWWTTIENEQSTAKVKQELVRLKYNSYQSIRKELWDRK